MRSGPVRPQPVVLAPGLLCDERLWGPVRQRLQAPASVADFTRDDTLPAMGRRLLKEAPARFVLAGFSMGGMVALLAAFRAPQRIAGLALIDTHADGDTAERAAGRLRHIAVADEGFGTLVREELKPVYFADPEAAAQERALVADMAGRQGPGVFRRHVAAILGRPDLASAARAIRAPTRVVVGAEDRIAPKDAARRLAELIPGAELVVLEGCGHLAPLERPAEIAALIDALAVAPQEAPA